MARRIVMGLIPGVAYDLRISRPGFDAMTANVNSRAQISFSAVREGNARVDAAGSISAINTPVSFGTSYAAEPPSIFALKRSGSLIIDEDIHIDGNSGRYQEGTPYCLVVTTGNVRVCNPMDFTYGIPAGDKFVFYTASAG